MVTVWEGASVPWAACTLIDDGDTDTCGWADAATGPSNVTTMTPSRQIILEQLFNGVLTGISSVAEHPVFSKHRTVGVEPARRTSPSWPIVTARANRGCDGEGQRISRGRLILDNWIAARGASKHHTRGKRANPSEDGRNYQEIDTSGALRRKLGEPGFEDRRRLREQVTLPPVGLLTTVRNRVV